MGGPQGLPKGSVEAPEGAFATMVSPVLTYEETMRLLAPVKGPRDALPAETEVAIIGAGPAGLTAANLLGSFGVRVLVLERHAATADLPKAIAVDDEYMRLLHRLGLGAAMDGHISPPFGVHFTSPTGVALARVPGFITPNGFGNRNAVSQPMFEKVLLDGARRFSNVSIRYDAELAGLTQDGEGVTLEVEDAQARAKVRALYVLACDGARSFVRSALKIPFEGTSLDQPHLVVDLAEVPDQVTFSRFICNPARPLNCVLGPYGGRRIEFMLLPEDDHKTIVGDDSIRRLVDLHTPYKGMPLKIIRRAVYGLAERIASRLQEGRVFLLGDAAHIMPPFGAQGMNTGARDASNLCWKIAAVLRDELKPHTLATYDLERREHIRQTIDYSVRIGKVANVRFWPLALLRDAFFALANLFPFVRRYFAEMRYMPKPVIRDGLLVHDGALRDTPVGRLLPRWDLSDKEGAQISIDDISRFGWMLIGIGVDQQTMDACARSAPWTALKARAVAIDAPGATYGFTGERGQDLFARLKGKVVALRPDNVVAGVASPGGFAEFSRKVAAKLQLA